MPFNTEKRSKEAQKRKRDAHGHFIPFKPKVKVSGQANLLSGLIDTSGNPDSDSMMGIYFKNPFKKLIAILEEIKDKQSTTVALKFTIPLIALPVAILMAFQFGRYQSACTEHFSSQVGTLQNITVERSVAPDHWFLKALSTIPFVSGIYERKETFVQPVLVKDDNRSVIIDNEANADLGPFTQSRIMAFGNYDSCSETLTLDSSKNISNY